MTEPKHQCGETDPRMEPPRIKKNWPTNFLEEISSRGNKEVCNHQELNKAANKRVR